MDKHRDPSTLNVGSEHLMVHVPVFVPDTTPGPVIPSLVTGFRADVATVPYMQVQNIYRAEPSRESNDGSKHTESRRESVARGSGFSN